MKKIIFGILLLLILIYRLLLPQTSDKAEVPIKPAKSAAREIPVSESKTAADQPVPEKEASDASATAAVSEASDWLNAKNVPEKYFYDWADDEQLKDRLFETWGENYAETFFARRDNQDLILRSRNLTEDNDFFSDFKDGIYRGHVFVMKKGESLNPDPQPFLTGLKKERVNGKSRLMAQWLAWKKATGSDGMVHPIWQNHLSADFSQEVYYNTISYSEDAIGVQFVAYFGMNHNCKESTWFISSRKYHPAQIEGDVFCRTSPHDFILMGLFSMTRVDAE